MKVPLDMLEQYCNPFKEAVWHGLDKPLTHGEIRSAVKRRRLEPKPIVPYSYSNPVPRTKHIARVAFLAVNGWSDAILIAPDCIAWPVQDGNHRLAAALFRGDSAIEAVFDGSFDAIVELFGPDIAEEAESEWL